MKRICILFLTLGLWLGLVGCTTSAPPAESGANSESSAAVSSEAEDITAPNSTVSDAASTDTDVSDIADENSGETSAESERGSTTASGSTTDETISVTNTTGTTKHNTTSKPFFTTVVTKATTTQTTAKTTTKATTVPTTKSTTKATTKPITTTTTGATTGDSSAVHAYCEQVWTLVNQERTAEGLSPLTYRRDLQTLADIRAAEIVESFSHTRPNGTSCFTVFEEANVPYWSVGENIAKGQRSPEEVVEDWMNSDGHRANILGDFDGIVVGYQNNHWVQLFIKD